MSEGIDTNGENNEGLIKHTINEVTKPFIDLFKAPRALWGINLSYVLEGLCYFGVVQLLAIYFNDFIGLDDINAGLMLSILTGGITFSMLILGATVDIVGVRKALIIALGFMALGRLGLSIAPHAFAGRDMWSDSYFMAMFGILGIMIGYGIFQPACYTAIKKFTNPKTAAMGYAMLYALMNLGGFLPGLISPPVRKAFGITGVFSVYTVLTVVGILVVLLILSNKSVKAATETETTNAIQPGKAGEPKEPLSTRLKNYLKRFPVRDYRFMFFIFILIPVQTLFAHNWLTLPQYCERAFSGFVSDNFELFVSINSILIFVITPMVAALTSKKQAYRMMILGTVVMASAPFVLVTGPNLTSLLIYLFVLTIGEAMWQPRFLQWVAEIAPKDMTGIYMGIGQFPWFLTKVLTGLYSGWFLTHYCPQDVLPSGTSTEVLWLIYGGIAIISPIGLILARKWMIKGFKEKAD